jgi:FMN reductase
MAYRLAGFVRSFSSPSKTRALVDLAAMLGSPVYKGSYPGLCEHLFDLINPSALLREAVLLTATGGGDTHALVIKHQLRPLFGFFEAATLATGVYASTTDFSDGLPTSASLLARFDRVVDQSQPWLGRAAA